MITAAEFRTFFPALSGAGDDARIEALISAADALASRWCGYPTTDAGLQTFASGTYTVYPSGAWPESSMLSLGLRPVISITSAHVSEDWSYGSADAIASGDMVLDTRSGRVYLTPTSSSGWSVAPRANKVVVVAGYATAPDDLKEALSALVRHLLDGSPPGLTAFSVSGQSSSRTPQVGAMPASLESRFAPFRLGSALGS